MSNVPAVDPHVLEPGHAPTPFTAAEIRAANPVGLTIRLRVEVAGEGAWTRVTRTVEADEDGASRVSQRIEDDGAVSEAQASRATWLELQAHASFPAVDTAIDEVTLDTPMGSLDCLRYTVTDGDAVDTFWFARSIPGMPVRTERAEGGRVVQTVAMLSKAVEAVETG